jgi:hypothetical protein
MAALLLTLALFAVWWLIGLAALTIVRADTTSLRVALTAPALGTAVTVLPLFVLSYAGVAMQDAGPPVAITLLVGAVAAVAVRRPALPFSLTPVLAVCVGGLLLAGWPMVGFSFRWIANANDDMANYALSATQLLHAGLLAPVDLVGLTHNRSYPSVMHGLHALGSRPGADITLAGLASLTGRPAYELFMPLIIALHLCMISGTAALAMQASRRWWAAVVAAALIAVSPMATLGVLQQLLPQVWGLGLASALFALLMRPELHRGTGPSLGKIAMVSLLVSAVIVVYVELASTLAVAYAIYLGVLRARRELSLRVAARLWIPTAVWSAVVLNGYGIRELRYVVNQARFGVHGLSGAHFFGFSLVPSALAGIVGFQTMPVHSTAHWLDASLVVAIALLGAIFTLAVLGLLKGDSASVALVCYAGTGIYLSTHSSDFGLYKLYMYVQPFIAAAVATWLVRSKRTFVAAVAVASLVLVIGLQISTQQVYVLRSRSPGALPFASSSGVLPAFKRFVNSTQTPLITVTENPTLGKLEAVVADQRPLYFISQNLFSRLGTITGARANGWRLRSFGLDGSGSRRVDPFLENTHAGAVLRARRCTIVLPTGAQSVLNRRTLPEGMPPLVSKRCGNLRNFLIFTASKLGGGFYAFNNLKQVSLYQVETDHFFPRGTMSGFGRYALFRVVEPSGQVRLEVNLTTTYMGATRLPPAAVVGDERVPLRLVGRGSARIFSAPLQPQIVGGEPYLLLDLGRNGKQFRERRVGIQGLYGRSLPIDYRFLTAYVRSVSLVSESQYRRLRPPSALRAFPGDLGNSALEYSGIDEDGWVSADSFAILAGGRAADLVVRADVPLVPGGQRLQVLVNGHQTGAQKVVGDHLELREPISASRRPRRIELRWKRGPHSAALNQRPALLRYLGIVPKGSYGSGHPPASLRQFPSDLANPDLSYSGIYQDGWMAKRAWAVLTGGAPADLLLRAAVPPAPGGQRLQVVVNGRQVVARAVGPGKLELRVPLAPSESLRRVELRWAAAPRLPEPDGRPAAALLQFLGVVPASSPPSAVQHFPADLTNPGLHESGIWLDGWVKQQAWLVLAGGPAADLVLRATVLPAPGGQVLHLRVNGHDLVSRRVAAGQMELRIPIPASRSPRKVELGWKAAPRLPAPDERAVAALLQFLGVVPTH